MGTESPIPTVHETGLRPTPERRDDVYGIDHTHREGPPSNGLPPAEPSTREASGRDATPIARTDGRSPRTNDRDAGRGSCWRSCCEIDERCPRPPSGVEDDHSGHATCDSAPTESAEALALHRRNDLAACRPTPRSRSLLSETSRPTARVLNSSSLRSLVAMARKGQDFSEVDVAHDDVLNAAPSLTPHAAAAPLFQCIPRRSRRCAPLAAHSFTNQCIVYNVYEGQRGRRREGRAQERARAPRDRMPASR